MTHNHETDTDDLVERLKDSKGWPNLDILSYRIKPEPVRETVTLMIDDGSMGGPQAIGTIDLIDGGLDCDSIKIGED